MGDQERPEEEMLPEDDAPVQFKIDVTEAGLLPRQGVQDG